MDANLLDNKDLLIQTSSLNFSQNDAIALNCGQTRRWLGSVNPENCVDYLSSFIMHKNWLIGLVIQYLIVIFVGIFVTIRAIVKRKQRQISKNDKLSNGKLEDENIKNLFTK